MSNLVSGQPVLSGERFSAEADRGISGKFRDTRRFRQEIHGIRGLAIAGVVLFHILGNGRVSGGIDVFLAITGFLAIPALMRRAVAGQGVINMVLRVAGLFRRILVPLLPVLIFVGVGGFFLLPLGAQPDLWGQERASVLFFENWQLVGVEQDYNAAGSAVSPLQHLWSIAIQMQFHLFAPFLVMALAIPIMRLDPQRWNVEGVLKQWLFVVLVGVSAASLWWAVQLQADNQAVNYFSTWSRTWEIALAGAAALLVPRLRLSSPVRAALSWLGLAMVLSTGFLFDGAQSFPGPLALWPIGGLLLVLAAGQTHSRWGTDRLWQFPPVVFLANISYSLYLWHWPIIIFWFNWSGEDRLSLSSMLIVLTLSGVAGWLGHVLFEKWFAGLPLFTRGPAAPWRTVLLGLVTIVVAAVAFTHLEGRAQRETAESLAVAAENAARSQAVDLSQVPTEVSVRMSAWAPELEVAWQDLPAVYDDEKEPVEDCFQRHSGPVRTPVPCSNGVKNPRQRILLTGGSHVDQWWGALDGIAKENDIELLLMTRTSCNFWDTLAEKERFDAVLESDPGSSSAKCIEWNRMALPAVLEMQPDLVVTLGTKVTAGETVHSQAQAAWETLAEAGIPTLLVRDNPYWGEDNDPITCLNAAADPSECFLLRSETYSPRFDGSLTGAPPSSYYLDVAPYFCDASKCPASVGNLPLYRDYMHITQSFSRTFQHVFEEALLQMGLMGGGSEENSSAASRGSSAG